MIRNFDLPTECQAEDCEHAIDRDRAEMWLSLGEQRLFCAECAGDLHSLGEETDTQPGRRDGIKYRTVGSPPVREPTVVGVA
ncbi:MAG: hypothetical protein ACOCR0_02405 [Haloferacaceae archaeon]